MPKHASEHPAGVERPELNAMRKVVSELHVDLDAILRKARAIEHKTHDPRARKTIRVKCPLADMQHRIQRTRRHEAPIDVECNSMLRGRGVMRAILRIDVRERTQHERYACHGG